jgi:osmotically-inducible protein OsmY
MGVEARVYGRLHWDKALYDAKIDLEARKDGVLTLRGTVPDAAARAKAVALARETVGVTEVIDQLTLGTTTPPTTPVEPEPAGARPKP